jgi:hypothetical protein
MRRQIPGGWSMMPKNAQRFSGDIMLQHIEIDHGHEFGSVRSKLIVI